MLEIQLKDNILNHHPKLKYLKDGKVVDEEMLTPDDKKKLIYIQREIERLLRK